VANANNSTKMPFVVRYKETNYQFLSRLAAVNGEWFYYNGLETRYGKLPYGEVLDIKFGKDLTAFEYGVTMKQTIPDYQYYDYRLNHKYEKMTKELNPGSANGYTRKALQISNKRFTGGHKFPVRENVIEEDILRIYANIQKAATLSNSTCFKGASTNPSLVVGGSISVNANTIVNGKNKQAFVNKFRLIQVTHELDATGNYNNSFEAIPLTITAPPVNEHVKMPEAESQVAVVVDNNDPKKLGRVRAQFKWQSGNELTPWVRVLTSSAAGGRGMYFIPEIDDEVYIDFDQGNPDRPYVMGALFHGKALPTWGSEGNDNKALTTRSGNSVNLSDADGSITISDPSGNTITLGGNGEISISAPNTINLDSTNININASSNVSISAGANISNSARANASMDAGANLNMNAGANLAASAGSKASLTGSSSVSVSGKRASFTGMVMANIQAGAILTVVTAGILNLTGAARNMVNGAKVKVQGGKVELNS